MLNARKAVAAVFGIVIFLSGCNKAPRDVVILGEDSANINAMEQMRAKFESTGSTKLKFEKVSFADAETKATQDFFNQTGHYDVVLQYNFLLSTFVRNGYVSTLTELTKGVSKVELAFKAELFPAGWKEVGYYYQPPYTPQANAEPIGYPFALNTMLLVYNKDLFENPDRIRAYAVRSGGKALAPPKTWEEFRGIAEFFTDTTNVDSKKHTHGVVMQGASDGWLYYEWMNFLFGQGGRTMDKATGWMGGRDTPILLDSPEAIAAAKYYVALKPYNAGDFFATQPEQQLARLRTGNVAMVLNLV